MAAARILSAKLGVTTSEVAAAIRVHLAALGAVAAGALGAAARAGEAARTVQTGFDHAFTHFRMRAQVHGIRIEAGPIAADLPAPSSRWVRLPLTAEAIAAAPLAAPVRALLLAELAQPPGFATSPRSSRMRWTR